MLVKVFTTSQYDFCIDFVTYSALFPFRRLVYLEGFVIEDVKAGWQFVDRQ